MKRLMNLYDDSHWEKADEYYKGTLRKVLREENGRRTVLLKLPAGFTMTPHSHIVTETTILCWRVNTQVMESYFLPGRIRFFHRVMNMVRLSQKMEP